MPHSKQMAFGSAKAKGKPFDANRLMETLAQRTEEATLCIAHFKLKLETSKATTSPFRRRESAAEPQPKHQTVGELVKSPSTNLRRGGLDVLRLLRRGKLRVNGDANAEKRGRGEVRNGVW